MLWGLHVFATVSIFLALLTVAVEQVAPAYAHEYVVNGGFEDGTAGWSSSSADIAAVAAAEVTPLEGQFNGRVTLSHSAYLVRQSAFGVPPGTYTVSVGLFRIINSPQILVAVENQDASFTEQPGPAGWSIVSSTFTVSAFANLTIDISGSGSVGDVFFVDALHVDGPDPATPPPPVTPSSTETPSPTVTTTGTRTPSPTRTPTATRTATPSPVTAIIDGALDNGGFEDEVDGAPAKWRHYGGALSVTTSPVRSAGRAARFESTSESTKWFYQSVTVDSGETYAFDAWVYDDDPAVATAYLRVSWYASTDTEGSSLGAADSTTRIDAPAAGYRHLSTGPINAPADAHSARLRIVIAPVSAAPAVIYADDATFGPAAPDPASTVFPVSAADDAADAPVVTTDAPRIGDAVHAPSRATTAPPTSASIGGHILINEVMYNPGSGADGEGEWVELYNSGASPVDLGGWSLADAASRDVLPARVAKPGDYLIVAASVNFLKAYPDFTGTPVILGGHFGNGLGNDGDRLILRDAMGAAVDAISWDSDTGVLNPSIPGVPAGHSIERRAPGLDADTAADFADNLSPSPGGPMATRSVESAHITSPNGPVAVVASRARIVPPWLPWAVAVASGIALACAVAWRALPLLRRRIHFRG